MINEPEFEVLEIFNDNFAAWQFGELDYIDNVNSLIDGKRTRFPLIYKGELVSFEINLDNPDSANIDLEAVLLVYVNGVVQEPNVHYRFVGGTSIVFSDPPNAVIDPVTGDLLTDNVDIFFYRGLEE